jgi:23S rRNA (cytidine1920-2'-O)/16S rRNA (cytidine1409-2'-O)-methyltransferase
VAKKPKTRPLLNQLVRLYPETPRERLYSRVLAGDVQVDGALERDPKVGVTDDAEIVVSSRRFVSRGGFKLDAALETWKIEVADKVLLDAGCSTGGFTDALLQRGARAVHAVDVGTAQLDWKLRSDPRVLVREGTNIMAVTSLDPRPDGAVADLSFRSLRGAAAHILSLTAAGWLIALVKPQFEWMNPPAEFDGIVPDDRLDGIIAALETDLQTEGVAMTDRLASPVRGRKGNQEFLARLVLK